MTIIIISIYLLFISILFWFFVYVKTQNNDITKLKHIKKIWDIMLYIISFLILLWFIFIYYYNNESKKIIIKDIQNSKEVNY